MLKSPGALRNATQTGTSLTIGLARLSLSGHPMAAFRGGVRSSLARMPEVSCGDDGVEAQKEGWRSL